MSEIFNFLIQNEVLIYLLLFTVLLGFEVISKVPSVLHTPLMSGANAISGIVILGAIILIRSTDPENYFTLILASIALFKSDTNNSIYFTTLWVEAIPIFWLFVLITLNNLPQSINTLLDKII